MSARRDHLSAEPFRQIIVDALPAHGSLSALALATGCTDRSIRSIVGRERKSVTVQLADTLVLRLIGPHGWHVRPELRALYG